MTNLVRVHTVKPSPTNLSHSLVTIGAVANVEVPTVDLIEIDGFTFISVTAAKPSGAMKVVTVSGRNIQVGSDDVREEVPGNLSRPSPISDYGQTFLARAYPYGGLNHAAPTAAVGGSHPKLPT